MRYKNVFELKGTVDQQNIVIEGLDKIKFPFERLAFPNGYAIIGWANLNGQRTVAAEIPARMHGGSHAPKGVEGDAEPIYGQIEGREYILGVFYPHNGNIYIDNDLVNYPAVAQGTVSAEIAHAVDYFLPLTETHKQELTWLVHGGDKTEHGHSWWEKVDYGTEYFTLVGEIFMHLFTIAYSDMELSTQGWAHEPTRAMAGDVRRILGIERTDYVPPKDEPLPTPKYVRFGKSLIYHHAKHYPKKTGQTILDTTGLRKCKVCEKRGLFKTEVK